MISSVCACCFGKCPCPPQPAGTPPIYAADFGNLFLLPVAGTVRVFFRLFQVNAYINLVKVTYSIYDVTVFCNNVLKDVTKNVTKYEATCVSLHMTGLERGWWKSLWMYSAVFPSAAEGRNRHPPSYYCLKADKYSVFIRLLSQKPQAPRLQER